MISFWCVNIKSLGVTLTSLRLVLRDYLVLVWIEEYWSVFRFNPPHGENPLSFLNYDPGLDENTLQYSCIQTRP
jgi:hypothetical protein